MSFIRAIGLILLCANFFAACKKPALEDTALIPSDTLNLWFTDTLTVRAWTVREDSTLVTGATACLLGTMDNADFGKTNASFYIPFSLPTSNLVLADSFPVIDSLVLVIKYSSIYGDASVPQSVEVLELTEGIVESTNYYSNHIFQTTTPAVGTKSSFNLNTTDSIIRISLDTATLGKRLIDASGTTDFSDNTNFRAYFKGLHVKGIEADGGKSLAVIAPGNISLRLYMHDSKTGRDSIETIFPATSLLVVNHFSHDYSGSTAEPFIANPNTSSGDSLVFIQGLAGLNTKIEVPTLRSLGDILINRAELVLTLTGSDTIFPPPSLLTVLKADVNGNMTTNATIDQTFSSIIAFGGTLLTESDSGGTYKRYKFNLSRHYQQVAVGSEDIGLYMLAGSRWQTPSGLIAGGGSNYKYALKLNLTYTVVED